MTDTQTRRTTIKLLSGLQPEEEESLRNRAVDVEGLLSLETGDTVLHVEYLFPDCWLALIWELLADTPVSHRIGSLDRTRIKVLAFLETNERDHLLFQDNWYSYVTDIHLHYHARIHATPAADHKQLWRRHQFKQQQPDAS